ncbi:UNVERIFIED_CONTAM: hypothetical protein FKN15_022728 [Acipenser sinensis]
MQTVPNIFIASLAAGDLLLLLTCVPVDASRYFADTWLFGRAGCKIISFIQLASVGVSVFTLTVLSADRYRAIVRPMDLQGSDAVLWTICKVGCIWMLSMLLAVPEAVFSDLYSFNVLGINSTFETCAPYPVSEKALQETHSLLCFLAFYLIPLAIISVYYILIASTLVRSACNMPGEEHPHIRKQMESRKRLAKTVLVFVFLFALCWLPNHALYPYRSFTYSSSIDSSTSHLLASFLSRALAFSSSMVNPFALYWLSKTFRQHFKAQLCFVCHRRHLDTRRNSLAHSQTGITMATEDPLVLNEIREDLRTECEKFGQVKKVLIFDRHPDGVASVAFKEPEEADVCQLALNGRWFGGRKLSAELWDGKTDYQIEETSRERDERLKGWSSFLGDNSAVSVEKEAQKGEGPPKEDGPQPPTEKTEESPARIPEPGGPVEEEEAAQGNGSSVSEDPGVESTDSSLADSEDEKEDVDEA